MFKTIHFLTFFCLVGIISTSSCEESTIKTDIKIQLSESSITLATGDTTTLSATVKNNALGRILEWGSTDQKIVMVDTSGNVRATGYGSAKIYATMGEVNTYCEVTVTPSLYISGWQENSSSGVTGLIWRNEEEYITLDSSSAIVYINDITVSEGQPFYAGTVEASGGTASGMSWFGSDVYEDYGAGYSANGVAVDSYLAAPALYCTATNYNTTPWSGVVLSEGSSTTLTGSSSNTTVHRIAINSNNNTVYVVGSTTNPNGITSPVLWTGTSVAFLNESTTDTGSATGIFIDDNDIYISGYVGDTALVWHNGVADTLSSGPDNGKCVANCIYPDGSTIYAAGYTVGGDGGQIPVYWLDSEMIELTEADTGVATGITMMDGDVYICGYIYDGSTTIATLWKNGSPSNLVTSTTTSSIASAIVTK